MKTTAINTKIYKTLDKLCQVVYTMYVIERQNKTKRRHEMNVNTIKTEWVKFFGKMALIVLQEIDGQYLVKTTCENWFDTVEKAELFFEVSKNQS